MYTIRSRAREIKSKFEVNVVMELLATSKNVLKKCQGNKIVTIFFYKMGGKLCNENVLTYIYAQINCHYN